MCVCVCVCVSVCVSINLYVLTNSSTQAGCEIKSIFKRSLTGLNSEFSFS